MALETRNLGLVQAIFVGLTPPTNTDMLWLDTSVSPRIHKWYNTVSGIWEPLRSTIENDIYRQGTSIISGSTQIDFSSPLSSTDYVVEVLSFISNTGVKVNSGWTIPEGYKNVNNFVFNPSAKYTEGVLLYRAILFK